MAQSRRPILFNDTTSVHVDTDFGPIQRFHAQLPRFQETPLVPLDDVARKLGVRAVFVKDESSRLGLPAFKILGASWGVYRAVIDKLGLPSDAPLDAVAQAAQAHGLTLCTASEGNHGRAVAAMARLIGAQAHVYLPSPIHQAVVDRIASEGAQVTVSRQDYDGAMMEALAEAMTTPGGLFVQDSSLDGYEQIPKWIVEGYGTLLAEAKQQLAQLGLDHDLIVTPAGVGSLARAVVRHSKASGGTTTAVLAVEPDTAPCVYKSVQAGQPVSVQTAATIMEGLNCGTVSLDAFPDLKAGIDAAVTVSDYEAHEAVAFLQSKGISSGPCGAATLAALWRLADVHPRPPWLHSDAVVVLLNTEGAREYVTPLDVRIEDPVQLTQLLTTIDSSNPDLSIASGAGERGMASYLFAWLQHRDLDAHWLEKTPGRPSVVGVLKGTGGGRSLMLNGHVDTVSLASFGANNALSGALQDGRIYGRGSLDMKSGLAASLAAIARLQATAALPGDLILAAVADEESYSKGTEELLAAGWTADAAIIPEPTDQAAIVAHKGFVWVEVDILGVAAHGSLPAKGVDAILLAGFFQTALLEYAQTLPSDPRLGQASLHGGRIVGGEEPSSYPALVTLTVEFRTIPSQTTESIVADLETLLRSISAQHPQFAYRAPRVTFSRPASSIGDDGPIVQVLVAASAEKLGVQPEIKGVSLWADSGLLNAAGIPTVLYGPAGEALHGVDEWVSVASIRDVASVLEDAARTFLAGEREADSA